MNKSDPCLACPWRRNSAPGWLGGEITAAEWAAAAHAEDIIECHKRKDGSHCVGAAVYRSNVCKVARPPNIRADPV